MTELPNRKRLRLKDYNYSFPGAYFITVCTHEKKKTLSEIVGAIHESPAVKLTPYGKIIDEVINTLPRHLGITVDRYVIMPNHIHLILIVEYSADFRAIRESPLQGRSVISKTIGYIKMNSSKIIHERYGNKKIWQRGFHDHIIRGKCDYEKIAKYIYENPLVWERDCFY